MLRKRFVSQFLQRVLTGGEGPTPTPLGPHLLEQKRPESILLSGRALTLPAYWATWGAALLILPDLILQREQTPARLVRVAILVATSVLYIYTRNFWLCWILHALPALMFAGVPLARIPRSQVEQVHDRA